MILGGALISTLLLAVPTLAKSIPYLQQTSNLDAVLARYAKARATLTRRQDSNAADPAPQVSTIPASGDAATADLAKWDAATRAACDTAIRGLDGQVSNPTGLAVCYNLPFLDNSTGVFLAELRMYNVSAPSDPWVGIRMEDINLSLFYLGAMAKNITWPPVQSPSPAPNQKRKKEEVRNVLVDRQNAAPSPAGTPPMLKVHMFVGQINSNLMGTPMTKYVPSHPYNPVYLPSPNSLHMHTYTSLREALQPLLTPQIDLFTLLSSGADITTTVSSQNASFVNGVFANEGTATTKDPKAAASATVLAAQATPFVLPGTNLAFFPVGLVITCVWTAGLFLAVGAGTVGRMQYREQYRRRVKRGVAAGVRTI